VTRVLAHRGDAAAARENSIEAFLAAVAAGADGVELDVRRSADGALVVHHDAVVPGLGAVAALRVRDLPADVALLDEALDVLVAVVVNVEVKNAADEPGYDATGSLGHEVAAALEARDPDRVVVSSFDLPTLDAVRQASAWLATGWLLGYAADPRAAVPGAVAHGVSALHPWVLTVDGAAVEAAHAAGLDVATWTVNARADLERMVGLGVDTVITDDVALALAVVAEHQARNGVAGPSSA
jgi:glycerophosphoryl diester phosphodiesterase